MTTSATEPTALESSDSRDASSTLTGTWTLLRFALHRDRIRLPVWILSIVATTIVLAAALPGAFVSEAELQARADMISEPGAMVFAGPRIGVEDYTLGALLTNEMLGWIAVLVALLSILTVVRHTRADEEAGRLELLRANVLGRHAQLAAATSVNVLVNVVLAVLIAVGLSSLGIESIDTPGSWLFGLSLAGVGLAYGAVAAVAAQISEHGSRAAGLTGAMLAAAYPIRAIGDISGTAISWLSPIDWAQRTYAYVDDQWWPLFLPAAFAIALTLVAAVLSSRRDIGAGLQAPRPGPDSAAPALGRPLGLTARMLRPGMAGWAIAIAGVAVLYGALLDGIDEFAAASTVVQNIMAETGASSVLEGMIAQLVSTHAIIAATYGAAFAMMRARADEIVGFAEPVLATATARSRWLASYLIVATAASLAMLLGSGLVLGGLGAITTGDAGLVPQVLTASLVYVAPVYFTIAVAVAFLGVAPNLARFAVWFVIGYALSIGKLGELFGIGGWAPELSPFNAVRRLPAAEFTIMPTLVILALAAGLTFWGLRGMHRRDIYTT